LSRVACIAAATLAPRRPGLQARLAKEKVSIAPSSVFRFLRHVGLTFKKSLHAAEQDRPDVAAARSALRRRQPRLDVNGQGKRA
jgi:transposase